MIEGRRVLVTGASSGIGAATAVALARAGAVVGLVGRRADRLAAVLDECRGPSPRSRSWVTDLADPDRAESVLDEAVEAFGGLDVLVNNAAIPKVQPVALLTPEVVESVMRTNFFSPVRMTLRVLPAMLQRASGMIVNVASMGGRLGIAHEAAYCASKFALSGWSEAMAIDLHGSGVAVRLIQPGPIQSDIWDRPGERRAVYDGPKERPEMVAQGILAAIEGEAFEHYLPDLRDVVAYKQSDIDGYIATAAALAAAARGAVDTGVAADAGRES